MENTNKRRKLNNSEFTNDETIEDTEVKLNININLEYIEDADDEYTNDSDDNDSDYDKYNLEENNTSEEKSSSDNAEHLPTDIDCSLNEGEFIVSEDRNEDIDSLDYKYGNFQKYQEVSDYTTNYGENEDGDYDNW